MSIPEIISLVASIITIITGTISIVVVFTSRVKVVAPPYQGPPPLQQVPTQPAAPWQPSPVYPSVPWQPAPVRSPSRVPQSQSQLGTLQAWLLLSMRYGLPFGVAASLVEYGYVRLLSVLLQGESESVTGFFI